MANDQIIHTTQVKTEADGAIKPPAIDLIAPPTTATTTHREAMRLAISDSTIQGINGITLSEPTTFTTNTLSAPNFTTSTAYNYNFSPSLYQAPDQSFAGNVRYVATWNDHADQQFADSLGRLVSPNWWDGLKGLGVAATNSLVGGVAELIEGELRGPEEHSTPTTMSFLSVPRTTAFGYSEPSNKISGEVPLSDLGISGPFENVRVGADWAQVKYFGQGFTRHEVDAYRLTFTVPLRAGPQNSGGRVRGNPE
ncbi:MAG: hypothetical protein ACOYJ2_08970 [Rickettsiales bacterium]